MTRPDAPYFVTVDAESEVIAEGVQTISRIRDDVERESGITIPIVWFVRFQRGFTESVNTDHLGAVNLTTSRVYDGFHLAKSALVSFQERGDEIGWHYHAYHYVHRPDLSHEHRIAILAADIAQCAHAIERRHPEFDIHSFRFGWFFLPDPVILRTLRQAGIMADASIDPKPPDTVAGSTVRYPKPLVENIAERDGVWLFPRSPQTLLTHDWELVPHDLKWTRQDEQAAQVRQNRFRRALAKAAHAAREQDQPLFTYRDCLHLR